MKVVNNNFSIHDETTSTTTTIMSKNFPQLLPRKSPIHKIHPHDVLCGRGRGVSRHIGNVRWRELISDRRKVYANLENSHKACLSQSIVYAVKTLDPPGRFLQRNSATNSWYEIGDQRAQEKTSQALREAAARYRKGMTKKPHSDSEEDYHQPQKPQQQTKRKHTVSSEQPNDVLSTILPYPLEKTSSNHNSSYSEESSSTTKRRRLNTSLSMKNLETTNPNETEEEEYPWRQQQQQQQQQQHETIECIMENFKIYHKYQNQLPVSLREFLLKDFSNKSLVVDHDVFIAKTDHSSHSHNHHHDNSQSYNFGKDQDDSLFFRELDELVEEMSWSSDDDSFRCDEDFESSLSSSFDVLHDKYCDTPITLEDISFPELLPQLMI